MTKLATAFVELESRAPGLRNEIRRLVQQAVAGLTVDVPLGADDSGLRAEVRRAADLAANAAEIDLPVEAATEGLRSEVAQAARQAAAGVDIEVPVEADARGLRDEVSRAARAAEVRQAVALAVKAAPSPLLPAEIRKIAKQAAQGVVADIPLDVADAGGFAAEVRRAIASAEAQAKLVVDVDADAAGLRGEVTRASAVAEAGQSINVPVRADADAATGSLNRFTGALGGSSGAARGLGGTMNLLKFPALASGISVAAGSVGALTAGVVALTSALGPAAGLLGALPGLATTASQGLGTLLLAGAGVGDAVKALAKDQLAAGQARATGAKMAETALRSQEAASERVRSAVGTLSDVEQRAAEANVSASRRVENAQRGVVDARQAVADAAQQSADGQAEAARRVEQAERSLADAQEDGRRAQEDLNEARRSAEDQLRSLQERVDDYALSEEDAALRIREARERAAEVNIDRSASQTERDRANLGVRQAEEAYDDLLRARDEDSASLAEANARGVEGSDEVVAARDRAADSEQRVRDAVVNSSLAQRDQRRSAEEGARAIAQAQQGIADAARDLGDAQRSATSAQLDGAEDVAEAQRDLSLALRDQQRAASDASAATAAGASATAEAFARLSPEARRFAEVLFSYRPELDKLRAAAGERLFPALETALSNLETLLPVFEEGARGAGGAIGEFAVNLSDLLAASKGDIQIISERNVELIDAFGDATVDVVAALLHVIIAAEPVTDFIADSARAFGSYVRDAAAAGRESGKLRAFFDDSVDTLRTLGRITRNTGGILRDVFGAAAPLGKDLLDTLERLTREGGRFTSSVKGTAKLDQFFAGARPILSEIGGLVGDIATGFAGLATDPNVAKIISQLRTELLPALFDLASQANTTFAPALITLVSEMVELFATLAGQAGPLVLLVTVGGQFLGLVNGLIDAVPGMDKLVAAFVILRTIRFAGLALDLASTVTAALGAGAAATKVGGLAGALGKLKAIGPGLLVGGALLGITSLIEEQENAIAAAKRLRQEAVGNALTSNAFADIQAGVARTSEALEVARGDVQRLRDESGADEGGLRGFLGKLDLGARELVEAFSPLPGTVRNSRTALSELERAAAELDPRLAKSTTAFDTITTATGLSRVEVTKLADELGKDIAGPFGANVLAILDYYDDLAEKAGYSSSEAARAAGITLEALQRQATETLNLRDAITTAYSDSTSVVGSFAEGMKVSGQEILDAQRQSLEDTNEWLADLKILAKEGLDRGVLAELARLGPAGQNEVDGFLELVKAGTIESFNAMKTEGQTGLDAFLNEITARQGPAQQTGDAFGRAINFGVESGLFSSKEQVLTVARQVANDTTNVLARSYPREHGKNFGLKISYGIIEGFNAAQTLVRSATGAVIGGALAAARAAAGIRSPSRLFAQHIGVPIAQGIAEGIKSQAASVASAGSDLIGSSLDASRQALAGGLSGLDFSIPPQAFAGLNAKVRQTVELASADRSTSTRPSPLSGASIAPGVDLGSSGLVASLEQALAVERQARVAERDQDTTAIAVLERALAAERQARESTPTTYDIDINYPKPERSSTAIPRAIRRAQYLASF